MKNLSGKYAIITGGGQGLGAAMVKRFMEEQAAGVAILDYNLEKAQAVATDVGGNVIAIACDVSKEDQVKAAIDQVLATFGRIDILVNNAGIIRDAMFHKMTDDQWKQVIDVNLNGLYYCCKYVVPLMRAQCYGKIVNISSTSANGNAGQCNYSATKAAVEGFTKTLARESARKNITVNAIEPAHIDTEMQRSVPVDILESRIKENPSQRLGTPDELAGVAFFLASDDSSYVNGVVIPVCGGLRT